MKKLNKEELFNEFSINEKDFNYCEFNWNDLENIRDDYLTWMEDLEVEVSRIMSLFTKDCKDIHSIRYRIKDPNHLIAKIIRLKISNKILNNITIENYREEIKDILGFRLLHVFKEDWIKIYDYLHENYKQHENSYAYYRTGDDPKYIKSIQEKGIKVYANEDGYRSIHMILEIDPPKKTSNTIVCEVQIRTVFEEAWSEIGHSVRYPNNINNEHLNNYFKIYNRFVGTLDEMGTFIRTSHQNDKSYEKKRAGVLKKAQKILSDEDNIGNEKKLIKTFYNLITEQSYDLQPNSKLLKDRRAYFNKAIRLIREKPQYYRSVIEGPIFLHPKWVVKRRNAKYAKLKQKMPNYDSAVLKYVQSHSNPSNIKFIVRLSNRYKKKLDDLIPVKDRNQFKEEMIGIVTDLKKCGRNAFVSVPANRVYFNIRNL